MKKKIQDPISIDHEVFMETIRQLRAVHELTGMSIGRLLRCKTRKNPSVRKIKKEKRNVL